jgi:WD40 repeat protein/DNA-binding SARP family transcriptional activator
MSNLRLYLFGVPRVEQNETAIHLPTRKATALLAYLALSDRPHHRNELATLLWPNFDQTQARTALRRTLSRLNQALGGGWATLEGDAVQLTAGWWVDVTHFRQFLAAPADLPAWVEAVNLYRADFMSGFSLDDSVEFDHWQSLQAESLRRQWLDSLEAIAEVYGHHNQPEPAITHLQRCLQVDLLRESAHRHLMRLYAQTGQRQAALRQYESCLAHLRRELGVAPTPETTTLYNTIQEMGEGGAQSIQAVPIPTGPQLPTPSRPLSPWSKAARWSSLALLPLLAALVFVLGRQASAERSQAQLTLSRQLTAQALNQQAAGRLDLALLLSLEAYHYHPALESQRTLWQMLDSLPPYFVTAYHQPDSPVRAVAFSPDGRYLAMGTAGGRVTLQELDTYQPPLPLEPAHDGPVNDLSFSPDGRWLASAGQDSTLLLWDTGNLAGPAQRLTGPIGPITSVAFAPQSRLFASAGVDQMIRLWEIGRVTPTTPPLQGHKAAIADLAFTPDGTMLASAGWDNSVKLWPVNEPGKPPATLDGHTDFVNAVAYSPDSRYLASAGRDGVILLWDMATLQSPRQFAGHEDWIRSLAFDQAGSYLLSAGNDGLFLWNLTTPQGRPQRLNGHSGVVWDVAAQSGTSLVASAGDDGQVIIWDPAVVHPLRQQLPTHQGNVTAVAFSPDGQTLFSASSNGRFIHWSAAGDRLTRSEQLELGNAQLWAIDPTGRLIAAAGGNDLGLYDAAAPNTASHSLAGHHSLITALAFSGDGRHLASGDLAGTVYLWDGNGRQQPLPLASLSQPVTMLAFTPDGRLLLTASNNGAAQLWPIEGGQPLAKISGIARAAVSDDSAMVAAGGLDGVITLYRLTERGLGDQLQQWESGLSLTSLAFSPDGRYLAAGGWDGAILLWQIGSDTAPLTLNSHTRGVASLAFSPDGRFLASGSYDDSLILWNLDPAAWRAVACQIAHRNLTTAEWQQFLGDERYRESCP